MLRPIPAYHLVRAHSPFRQTIRSLSTPPSPPQSRPLDGITVVSLEQAIAAPFCTRQLADLGARVIKVERPPTGDFARAYDTRVKGLSSHFVWTNRGKESLALDLKNTRDLAVLKKLVGKADVLVQNLAPGAAERLGLGYEQVREGNEGIIVCDISGYGSGEGEYQKKKAYDLLIQAEAGMLSVTGHLGHPAKVGISIADISAGMYAYTHILAALLARKDTGKGRRIDISMLESMVEWMGFPLYYTYAGAPGPQLSGAAHAAIYPYGPFKTRDGEVMLGLQNEREWARFCGGVLDCPELASDARFASNALRVKNRDALKVIIEEVFGSYSAQEVLARLDEAEIANARVNDMQDVWQHPQLEARKRWTQVWTENGMVPALLPPGFVPEGEEGLSARMDGVPALGEHNEKILKELGEV